MCEIRDLLEWINEYIDKYKYLFRIYMYIYMYIYKIPGHISLGEI